MLTFGFYNSKGGDRKYDAEQIGAMFNGLITDGVFAHYKNALKVVPGNGNRELVISSGRAWFNGTWTEVDDKAHSIYLMGSAVKATYFVYLAVNKLDRKNTIAWYSNIANNDPENGLYFYLLAQVTIPGGATKISDSMITDTRGSDLCPYVTGIMETVSFEEIVKRVCGDSWKDWLGVYEAGITTGVQNAVATSERALDEVKSMKAYAVESEAVSYIWAKFEAVPTGGGGFEWTTDSVHTELSDPPMPMCLFRDLSYADLGPGFKPNISLNSPYIADGETSVKPIPAVTQSKVWKEYPYFWESGDTFGTEVLRYDDLQRVIVNVGGTATEKYRYRVSRLTHIPVTYEPGAYIGTVSADNATAYPRDGHKGGYYYMRFAARAEDVSFDYPDLSAKNVRDAIIEVVHMSGSGSGTAMSVIEVEELPYTGIKGVFYIVKKPGDSDANEYLWLDRWEKVGGTGSGQNVDLDTTLTKSGAAADAKAAGDKITEVMDSHETNLAAHPVIQNALEALRNQVNAALNSDDVTLDQLAEIVAYIKSNKTLIDVITTSKVSVADIVNDLMTNVANRPLSAAQGVELKRLCDSITASLNGYQPKGEYLTKHQDISHLLPRAELPYIVGEAVEEHLETEGLPDYWLEHLAQKIPAIDAAVELAGKNKSAFYFYTDAHRISSAGRTHDLLRYLYRNTSINKTNSGGDFFEPFADGAEALAQMREHMADLRGLPNHHSVIGNHDEDNAALTSDKQLYGFYLAWEESNDIVWGGYHYYYIDNEAERTRYVYLDTGKFAVSGAEMQFVIDGLNSTPEGWHVVVISHIWYDYQISAIPDYVQHLLDVFDAFNLRAGGTIIHNGAEFVYDFAKALGTVAFCIGGHVHLDTVLHSVRGIPVILTDSDSYYSRSGIAATEGTTGECCLDAVVADYDAGRVKLIRIGRGADRSVTLPAFGPGATYTNQLPISTDADGNIYNGKGWKENTRIGNTGDDAAHEGMCATGFIPCGNNAAIRVKSSVPVTNDYSGQAIALYAPDKTFLWRLNWSALNTSNFLVINDDGSIEYTLQASYWDGLVGKEVGYCRLTFPGINGDTIVTIDEAIE